MRFKGLTSLLAIGVLAVAGCGGDDDDGGSAGDNGSSDSGGLKAGDELTLGYAASKTGLLSTVEQDFGRGLEAQIDAINAEGGIDGKVKINLKTVDCGSDPQKCSNTTQQLIDDGASFLIGPCDVDVALPAALLATKANVGMLSSCAGGPTFRQQAGKAAFLNTFSAPIEGAAMGEFAAKQGWKNVAIMTSSDLQYTVSIGESAAETTEKLGGKVVKTETAKLGQPQYTSQANALAASNPDVVMTSFFLPSSNTFIQNLRSAGYDGPVLGSDGLGNTATFAVGAAAKDVYSFNHAYYGDDTLPETKKFLEAYEAKYNKPPNDALAALGGDAALLVQAAVTEAGSTDPGAILEAFEGLTDVEGATEPITYADREGIPVKDVVVVKTDMAKKDFSLVERFYPEAGGE